MKKDENGPKAKKKPKKMLYPYKYIHIYILSTMSFLSFLLKIK